MKAFKVACGCLNCNGGIPVPVESMFLVVKNRFISVKIAIG